MTSDHRVAGSSPAGCMPQRQRLTYQEGGRCESMLGHFSRLAALADKMTDRIMSTVVRSIAAAYAETIRNIEHAAGVKIERICVMGGGSQNQTLNRLTEQATALPLVLGPPEATARGNIIVQMETMEGARLGPPT